MSELTSLSSARIRTLTKPIKPRIKSSAHRAWERWKVIARKIGDFQARLLLTLFYIFVLGPFALLVRLRGDPLGIKSRKPGGWMACAAKKGDPIDRAHQQF